MHPGSLQWDLDLIADIFQPRDQQLIFNIPLSSRVVDDQWYWTQEEGGIYSVKTGYRVRMDPIISPFSHLWTKICHLQIPPKVRIFVWIALRGFLPTADNLRSRMVLM